MFFFQKKRGPEKMGNIVLKEDGFTPIIQATDKDKVPTAYMNLAQSYVDKIASQPEVRKSQWRNVWVISRDTGDFILQCGFDTLLPHHSISRTGQMHHAFGGVQVDFSRQIAEIRAWLPIKENIRMIIGPGDEYLVWINLILPPYNPREETIKAQEAEIARLKEMLYWSPQGQGFQDTKTHFKETSENLN